MEVDIYLNLGKEIVLENSAQDKIKITRDKNGNLSVNTENSISSITKTIENSTNLSVKSLLENLAVTINSGSISLQVGDITGNQITLVFTSTTDDILPDNSYVNESVSVSLKLIMTFKNKTINPQFQLQPVAVGVGAAVVITALVFNTPTLVAGGAVLAGLSLISSNNQTLFNE